MGIDDELDGSAAELIRRRLHKVNDMVQVHEGKIGEHGVLIGVLTSQVEALRSTTASREQLDHGLRLVTEKMGGIEQTTTSKMESIKESTKVTIQNSEDKLTLKIENLRGDLTPIKRGINGIVWLVIVAVMGALLALVLRS